VSYLPRFFYCDEGLRVNLLRDSHHFAGINALDNAGNHGHFARATLTLHLGDTVAMFA
jgi:hypothetical protein